MLFFCPLQEAINKLQEWSQENDIIVNRDKTKIMKFRKGGILKNTDTCGGQILEIVKSYKYLGITLQVTGHTFSKHIEDRAVRAMKATVEIKKQPIIHSYSPEILHHKGCAHCHIWHKAHMEPP